MLNSQFYKNPQLVPETAKEQDLWLDEVLKKAAGNRIIVFSHVPWFDLIPEELNWAGNIPSPPRLQMLNKLYNAGKVTVYLVNLK